MLVPRIAQVKQIIWSDIPDYEKIILHEKEVKDATEHRVDKANVKPEYLRFYNNTNNCTKLYKEYHKNAVGNIKYESRENSQNIAMSQHFHQIKAIGTMYVNSRSIQKYIRNIDFPSKQENIAGLQLADFIPNQIAKKSINKKIYANTKDFNANIYRKTYDGACGNKNRFGIRTLPKD